MATAVLVASGFTVSSAFTITRPAFALHLPHSMTASAVRLQFAQTLAADSAGFATLQGENALGPWVAYSGAGPFVSAPIPTVTPHVRIHLATAAAIPTSFTALPLVQ